MKALVGAFNQKKALVGAFSVIVKTGCGTDGALHSTTFMCRYSAHSSCGLTLKYSNTKVTPFCSDFNFYFMRKIMIIICPDN